jgi:hypothetical protein
LNGSIEVSLCRDGAANTLALRNGAAAQTFNVYGTYTTATTNFERLAIKYNATDVAYQIAAEKGSTNGDYRPLDFVTGGSRRMTIGTTGNVGIGTTAPGAKLHVTYANQTLTGNDTDLNVSSKHHIAAYTPDAAGLNVGASLGLGGNYFGTTSYITFGAIAGRKELATNNNAQGYLSFLTASNGSGLIERMRIDSAGNVGIGTTAPAAKLDILTSASDDGIKITNSGTTSSRISLYNNSGHLAYFCSFGSGISLGLTNNASFGGQNSIVIASDATVPSGGTNSVQFRAGGYNADQERMRITAAGNVGIGTTAPSSKLQVTGGDVEIETVTSGIIMKAAGTSTRYRITLNAGGTALVFTAI